MQELPQDDIQVEGQKKSVQSQQQRMETGQARVANLRAMLKR